MQTVRLASFFGLLKTSRDLLLFLLLPLKKEDSFKSKGSPCINARRPHHCRITIVI